MRLPVVVTGNEVAIPGYNRPRMQTDACLILDRLDLYKRRKGLKNPVLLVLGRDLYVPGLDFLFGLARPAAGAGVVSVERLRNGYYGRPENDTDLLDRAARECSHEFGHLFGLCHCEAPECIMCNPQTLDALDRKMTQFCGSCRHLLDEATSDPLC